MTPINKLPDNAVMQANLTVVNTISQKFYQIYFVEKSTGKWDVVTAHGRIGHTPKYFSILSNSKFLDATTVLTNTVKAKLKKGYSENKVSVNPISLLPKSTKTSKPILTMGTATILKPSKKIKDINILTEEKPIKKAPVYNRLRFLTE